MTTIADFKVIIRHENSDVRRSDVFATQAEAERWARANLDPTPRASKDMRDYARLTRTPLAEVATKESASIVGRKEGYKNYTVGVSHIAQ